MPVRLVPPAAILGVVDQIVVEPNGPLRGTVSAGGAKNSALKLMAACLLAEGCTVLSNVPRISDVDTMAEVLRAMGAQVERLDNGDVSVTTPPAGDLVPVGPLRAVRADAGLGRRPRAAPGPLRLGAGAAARAATTSGTGRSTSTSTASSAMGARFESSHGEVRGTVPGGRLVGTRVVLEYPSHTATDNLLMAAVAGQGHDGDRERGQGARGGRPGRHALRHGRGGARARARRASRSRACESLRPTRHAVVPDRVVAATYLAAVGMAGGEVTIADARPDHMEMLLRKVSQMGVATDMGPTACGPARPSGCVAADVATLPVPGRGDRLQPAARGHADGGRRRRDPDREPVLRAVPLRRGAAPHGRRHPDRGPPRRRARACPRLSGAPVRAPDIRAGVALVLAGLVAEGETVVSGAHHIGRGYEDLAGALCSLGARVTRR